MADLFQSIAEVGTWIFSLFSTLLNFIIAHPVTLFPVGLALIGFVIGILFRVKGGLGLRSKRR